MKWVAKHTIYNPPHKFKDIMVKGPFWKWEHEHNFKTENGQKEVFVFPDKLQEEPI